MEKYQYRDLEPGHIRLLKFHSLREGELAFDMHHELLGPKTSSYAALSYCWGDDVKPCTVKIGHGFVQITKNLNEALIHVRPQLAKRHELPKFLWVDAICIDQSHDEEKNAQVALMSRLYSQASYTYSWLGKPVNDRNVSLACEKMHYIWKLFLSAAKKNRGYRPWWLPHDRVTINDDLQKMHSAIETNINKVFDVEGTASHDAWLGIVELWQKDYWKRAWIMHESTRPEANTFLVYSGVIVSKLKPTILFLCGQYLTDWNEIVFSAVAADVLLGRPLLRDSTKMLRGAYSAPAKVSAMRSDRIMERERSFLDVLQRSRHCECTNPKDKVYANLGLRTGSGFPWITPQYEVEYSVLDLYVHVARSHLVQNPASLEFLGYSMTLDTPQRTLSKGTNLTDWPSWVPNWDDPLLLFPFPKRLYADSVKSGPRFAPIDRRTYPKYVVISEKAYMASGNSSVEWSVPDSVPNALQLKGVVIDVIAEGFPFETMTWQHKTAKMNEWFALAKKKYPGKFSTVDQFNRALNTLHVADIQLDFFSYPMARGNALNNDLLGKPRSELTHEELKVQTTMRVTRDRICAYRNRCLTEKCFLGLVPRSAKAGDLICVLLGGQVLYVLRPRDGLQRRYQFIGECFVCGLMDGEVMDLVKDGKAEVESLVII